MNRPTIEQFTSTSCELATPLAVFEAIYSMSNGKPCDGCAYDAAAFGKRCKAKAEIFRNTLHVPKPKLQQPQETVRETAARLGLSLSEVRRRRATQS